ncbi:cysteine-rich receptor-like protein kinase 3 [Neltuma alba]|uniref:cysteine-rich receptor-like protein kinase 3 n=1 Tax=Neltuma alba TaxID=207710 RepID=UPI0010A3FC06|nr:cysteine-rich receptor-like protein kinase 3 [Prosopis alba]
MATLTARNSGRRDEPKEGEWRVQSCCSLDGVVSDPQTNLLGRACLQYSRDEYDTKSFNDSVSATFRDLSYQVVNQSRFFATAHGNLPVYGIFQCRSYLSVADCAACFTHAAAQILNCSAGNNFARVIFDGCFLRYESTNILEQTTGIFNTASCGNQSVEVAATAFTSAAQQLLMNLQTTTPTVTGFSAATKTQVPDNNNDDEETIYAYAQCTETISQSGCEDCLKQGVNTVQTCLPNSDGRAFDAGCFIRYPTISFFPDNHTIHISNNPSVKQGDITGASKLKGPVTYNYGDLKYATKNFSVENKLGEGGFGVVYKGTLKNEKVVAVKKLTLRRHSKRVEEEFESEVKAYK